MLLFSSQICVKVCMESLVINVSPFHAPITLIRIQVNPVSLVFFTSKVY